MSFIDILVVFMRDATYHINAADYANLSLTCKEIRAIIATNFKFKFTWIDKKVFKSMQRHGIFALCHERSGPAIISRMLELFSNFQPELETPNNCCPNNAIKTTLHNIISIGCRPFNPGNPDSVKHVVNTLKSLGVDLNAKDSYGNCILTAAVVKDSIPMVELLLEAGVKIANAGKLLHESVNCSNTFEMSYALLKNTTADDFKSPQFSDIREIFCVCLHPTTLHFLIDKGLDLDYAAEHLGVIDHMIKDFTDFLDSPESQFSRKGIIISIAAIRVMGNHSNICRKDPQLERLLGRLVDITNWDDDQFQLQEDSDDEVVTEEMSGSWDISSSDLEVSDDATSSNESYSSFV